MFSCNKTNSLTLNNRLHLLVTNKQSYSLQQVMFSQNKRYSGRLRLQVTKLTVLL